MSTPAYSLRMQVYADSTLAGQPGFLVEFMDDGGTENVTIYLLEEEGRVRILAFRDRAELDWEFFPPDTYWAPAIEDGIGASWRVLDQESGGSQTATLEGFDNVTTPAGSFDTARCVTRPDAAPGTISNIMSFAAGIGHVRWIFAGDSPIGQELLTGYHIEGGLGYMPLAVGNWWEYENFEYFTAVDGFPSASTRLYANFPNPFNPQTTISFDLPSEMAVNLRVYDVSGRLVKNLVDSEVYQSGSHEAIWNGRDEAGMHTASGTYFYRLEAGGYVETKRMMLLK